MSVKVHCDSFRQEQFVPARQVRSIMSVYIASREERSEGLGCYVKDLFSGEEQKLKISALTKMGARFPDGKKVKAYALRGGETYTLVGTPKPYTYGAFIVPRGDKYEYIFEDRPLSPGSCIVWDGEQSKIIGYRLFRKLFIMGPNPVSQGRMRGNVNPQGSVISTSVPSYVAPQVTQPQGFPQGFPNTQPQGFPQGFPNTQPQGFPNTQQVQPQTQTRYIAIGRIIRNGLFDGLVLFDGVRQEQVSLQQSMYLAENGLVKNVKAVNRNGKKFLSGNGISLEALPYIQV